MKEKFSILAIVGSPRENGNTDILVDRVIQGIENQQKDVNIEKVNINNINIKGCQGDNSCRKTGKCIISDDMTILLEKIKKTDALIIGSPIYRGNLPGQMKIFMDRMHPLEKEVDTQLMKRMRENAAMEILSEITPKAMNNNMMERKMIMLSQHRYRLEKKLNSIVIVVGAHPKEMPLMKTHLEEIAKDLGWFSSISGGEILSRILVGGVSQKGDILEKKDILDQAIQAGQNLILN